MNLESQMNNDVQNKSQAIIHRGSVKDIREDEGCENKENSLIFEYSDRYSVFDWGQMPDNLDNKGVALANMAHSFFTFLEKNGIPHHGINLVNKNCYRVKRVEVIPPEKTISQGKLHWNYDIYDNRPVNALVPLEIIFRFGIPQGSSILKRASNKEYLKSLGFEGEIYPGQEFDMPLIEYSSKLEPHDRYITPNQAQDMAALNSVEWKRLRDLTETAAITLKEMFNNSKIKLWDGKFEFAFTGSGNDTDKFYYTLGNLSQSRECLAADASEDRDFMLVDSIGPDELRLSYKGIQLSKQNLRNFYLDSSWHQAVEKAKVLADQRGESNWKDICISELKSFPGPLNPELKETVSMMYQVLANIAGKECHMDLPFPDAWNIDLLIKKMEQLEKQG